MLPKARTIFAARTRSRVPDAARLRLGHERADGRYGKRRRAGVGLVDEAKSFAAARQGTEGRGL